MEGALYAPWIRINFAERNISSKSRNDHGWSKTVIHAQTGKIKTLLNKVERFKSFVYGSVCVMLIGGTEALVIDIEPRRNSWQFAPSAVPISALFVVTCGLRISASLLKRLRRP